MQYTGGSLYQDDSLGSIIAGLTGATGVEGIIISNHSDFTTKNTTATTKNTTQDNTLSSLETKATGLEAGATGLEGRNATLTSDFVTIQSREDALLAGLTGASGLEARAVGFNNNITSINANLNGEIQNQINTKVADSIFQSLKTEFETEFTTFQNQLNQKVVTATQEVIDARQDSDDAVLEKKFCSIEEFAQTFLQTYTVLKPDNTPYNFNGKIQKVDKAPPIFSIVEKAQNGSGWDLKIKLTDYGYNVMSGNLVIKNGAGIIVNTLVKSLFDATTKLYTLSLAGSNSSGALIGGPFTFEYQASTSTAVYSLVLDSTVLGSIDLSPPTGALGNPVWGRWIGGTGDDRGNGISVYGDAVYVTGSARTALSGSFPGMGTKPDSGNDDTFVIKYNTLGEAQWGRWIGVTGIDYGLGISASSDGIYVTGLTVATLTGSFPGMGTKPSAANNADAFVIKYDSSGTVLWGRWIGGTGNDYGQSISVTSEGVYVTGYADVDLTGNFPGMGTKPGAANNNDAFVIKYNTEGTALWGRWIGGTGNDYGQSISATTDANGVSSVYVTGYTNQALTGNFPSEVLSAMGTNPSGTSGNPAAFVIKYDSSGTVLWGRWIGGNGQDQGMSISATSEGVYVTGFASEALVGNFPGMGTKPNTNPDAFVIKYSPAGAALWGRWIGGSGNDFGYGISAFMGAVYVTGYSAATLTGNFPAGFLTNMGNKSPGPDSDAFVIKYDASGEAVWGKWIGGSGNDIGYGISADANAVYVTGAARDPLTGGFSGIGTKPGNMDAFVIKYM